MRINRFKLGKTEDFYDYLLEKEHNSLFFRTILKGVDLFLDMKGEIRSKREMLDRMVFWGWNMRWSWDFDAHTIYDMLYYKLVRLEKVFTESGNCCWNQDPEYPDYKYMKSLRLAIKILKRLKDRDTPRYCIGLWERHDKKWGKLQSNMSNPSEEDKTPSGTIFRTWREKANTPELKEQERKEWRALLELDGIIYERDKRNFFKILERDLHYWWD